MAGKKKIINKNSAFQRRLIELGSKETRSLSDLESEFGASRQTIAKWQIADALPDIDQLENIADYYKVSTDYLLGRCDTMSPNVALREAVEYTGLSETAVKEIHAGFAETRRFRGGLSEEEKKEKLYAASQLLSSSTFSEMLDCLIELPEMALLENIKKKMDMRYIGYRRYGKDVFLRFENKEDRDFLVTTIRNANKRGRFFQEEQVLEKVAEMSDEELIQFLRAELADIKDKMDLCQFVITKAFNRYIDGIINIPCGTETFEIKSQDLEEILPSGDEPPNANLSNPAALGHASS